MKLSKVNKIKPEKRTYSPSDALILSRRDIGIEIECEGFSGAPHDRPPEFWSLVPDGSLRNGGIELVSSVVRGSDVIHALDSAQAFCKKNKLVHSARTSLHIHLDVRHLDTKELIELLALYVIFEKFFYSKCGDPERELNNHCRPLQSSRNLYSLIRGLHSESIGEVNSALANWPKYSAVNLAPVMTQGSVEFRHHIGTSSKVEILKWINLIFSLASYVRKNRKMKLQKEIDRVCEDGRAFFREVFPNNREDFNTSIHEGMLEGARYMQMPINTLPKKPEPVPHHRYASVGTPRRGATGVSLQVDMPREELESQISILTQEIEEQRRRLQE